MALVENYTTKISATKTAAEIQELLSAHGVRRMMIEFVNQAPSAITFEADTDLGPQPFRLPVDVDAMFALMIAEKKAGRLPGLTVAQAQDRAQAERVAWRVVAEWLRAQMTLIASKMATLDQVMLPYLVVDGNRTLYQEYRIHGLKQLSAGEGEA